MEVKEIAEMERLFIQGLDFKLHVSKAEFDFYSEEALGPISCEDEDEDEMEDNCCFKLTAGEAVDCRTPSITNFS